MKANFGAPLDRTRKQGLRQGAATEEVSAHFVISSCLQNDAKKVLRNYLKEYQSLRVQNKGDIGLDIGNAVENKCSKTGKAEKIVLTIIPSIDDHNFDVDIP
ncbi:hypothetical protein CEXT_600581 [Caerostris extrusa]|uniref:Uncharacterized protein n=1 Tax=Caerostris extrusa TaxID=172846 RepID=A0AAV4NYI8_CAEEX|nr:hypothetical protein CEXT_600581 [Caerostris extrusa]